MSLRDTQMLLWRAITWPTGVEDFLARSDPATRRAFAETFAQSSAFSRVDRVQVYAEAYFGRLYEVALDQYPITAWLAGKAPFHDLITDFVLAHPSQTPDIRRFAAPLPAFLRTHPLERARAGLADVAEVDWAIADAVDRADETRLRTEALTQLPPAQWPGARFVLTKTASILRCALPYSELRQAWSRDDPAPNVEPGRLPYTVVVWRQADHDVYQRTLEAPEARALTVLSHGGTFSEVCDAAAGATTRDAGPQEVVAWLRRWLADDLLVVEQPRSDPS